MYEKVRGKRRGLDGEADERRVGKEKVLSR